MECSAAVCHIQQRARGRCCQSVPPGAPGGAASAFCRSKRMKDWHKRTDETAGATPAETPPFQGGKLPETDLPMPAKPCVSYPRRRLDRSEIPGHVLQRGS